MALGFDLAAIRHTEFGVELEGETHPFRLLTVDANVQRALAEMVEETVRKFEGDWDSMPYYQASEKYGASETAKLSLTDDLARRLRDLHEAAALPTDADALSEPASVISYFTRMRDARNRRLTAIHRAGQFKAILKSRLIRLVTNALKMVEDEVFKLDADFDVLIDDQNLYILRPSSFEFVAHVQDAVLSAVAENALSIRADLGFVDFDPIESYAAHHPRAARYLASIRVQRETANVDMRKLRSLCRATGVDVSTEDGVLKVAKGHELGFLEVLDRRRYEVQLAPGTPERFRASSRTKIE
jgi:Domain of unknown function (DUF4868)